MQASIPEIVRELSSLPPERIAEVHHFILFLKTRQGQVVNQGDDWTEEDLRDVTNASLNHATATLLTEDPTDAEAR